MEIIPAASAMNWSIELERGLRSKKPGQSVEAILQIGPRLEQLSREPEPTMAVCNMFGLVPGEDRLFANTILLRLAEAFRSGDKHMKVSVLKVFLSCRKMKFRGKSKPRVVANQVELLRKVKMAFNTEDVESRALALYLLGCWADFAKDSAEIRHMVLSTLSSCHILEVKASLFAAGCFSELSDDFANVLLQRLLHLLTADKTHSAVILAGIRAFAKLGPTPLSANRAYKRGLKLVEQYSDENCLIPLLISLSQLSSKSTLLISQQVELLLSFLTGKATSLMQATVLKCLQFILAGGVCRIPISANLLKRLVIMIDEPKISSPVQCRALRILHKILLYGLPNLSGMDMLEFGKLLTVIETATQSPITSKRILSVQILVDLSGKVNEVSEFSGLPQRVSSTIIDLFTMLLQPLPDSGRLESEVKEEGQHLLKILLLMVEKHPNLTVWMLEKTFSSIEYLLNKQIVGFEGEEWFSSVTMKLLVFLHKFVLACIEKRNEAALSNQVKVLIEHIQESSFINYFTRTVYSLLLHSCFISCLSENDDKDIPSRDKDVGKSSKKCLVDQEIIALELAKKMLEEKEYWFVWKAGKYAASCGSWFMAAFIFGEITNKFQSKVCSWWLKSLAEFAHSEWRLQLILLEKHGSGLTNLLKMKNITIPLRDDLGEISEEIASNFHSASYTEELVAAYSGIRLSGEKLAEILISNQDFFFQRWFLNLRSQVLETVVDLLRILKSDSAMYFLTKRSFQLKRLAQEYDLLATSFIDMDYKSSRTVTFLAISCSLLAFCTGFPLLINGWQVCSNSMLIQPLLRQLWNIDHETCSDLMLLLGLSEQPESCFHLQSRNQTFEAREIIKVCRYAVKRYVGLKKKSEGENNGKNLGQLTNESLQLIFDILKRWLSIPSRVPNYFFYPRPCVGSELFAFNNDTRNPDATMMVLPGCQLSLSLCLQMKNIPSELPVKITKLYCILHSSTSFDMSKLNGESKEKSQSQSQLRFQDWTIDEMVDLNEKLHHYVSETAENTKHRRKRDDDNNGLSINSFVCFELNERRQGFSTCLLDVSAFPMGCYRIKWHSCCIDNHGSYWSLLPLNSGPVFTIHKCIASDS